MKSETISSARIIEKSINQPWFRDEVLVWKHETMAKVFNKILSDNIPGLNISYIKFMKGVHEENIPIFIVGGAVRDVIYEFCVGKKTEMDNVNSINDIDFGFGDSPENLKKAIKRRALVDDGDIIIRKTTGLVKIGKESGNPLEGKCINGYNNDRYEIKSSKNNSIPICIGTDLNAENICRDFTVNALWYDPINETVIDPTSKGIQDTIKKIVRIPVTNKYQKQEWWFKGNPSKILRYWKFIARGYTPDEGTRKFIIEKAKQVYSDQNTKWKDQMNCTIFLNNYNNNFEKEKFKNCIKEDLGPIGEAWLKKFFG
jgi:tRNA nucleotidyltransferase/poly(A) polymerase